VKLLSGDESWHDLTALTFHFQTQPLPNVVSWYVHQLPAGALEAATAGTLAAEVLVPLSYFAPRRWRLAGLAATVAFQTLILLTGNYTFFNLLTMAIALWLLDDDGSGAGCPPRSRRAPAHATPSPDRLRRTIVTAASGLLVVLSATQVYEVFRGTAPEPFNSIADTLDPLHLTSRYGLFAVMTTTRPEIVFEGSDDGTKWEEYEFKYKPGDLSRPPPWVAPHQPRLDWQMWFAALSDAGIRSMGRGAGASPARRIAGRPGPARARAGQRASTALRPRAAVRLPVHRSRNAGVDGPVVVPAAAGAVSAAPGARPGRRDSPG
jgi:hypothetical protein